MRKIVTYQQATYSEMELWTACPHHGLDLRVVWVVRSDLMGLDETGENVDRLERAVGAWAATQSPQGEW